MRSKNRRALGLSRERAQPGAGARAPCRAAFSGRGSWKWDCREGEGALVWSGTHHQGPEEPCPLLEPQVTDSRGRTAPRREGTVGAKFFLLSGKPDFQTCQGGRSGAVLSRRSSGGVWAAGEGMGTGGAEQVGQRHGGGWRSCGLGYWGDTMGGGGTGGTDTGCDGICARAAQMGCLTFHGKRVSEQMSV